MRQHQRFTPIFMCPLMQHDAGSPRFTGGSGSPLSQRQQSEAAGLSDAERASGPSVYARSATDNRTTCSDQRTTTANSDGRTTDTLHSLSGWNQAQPAAGSSPADARRPNSARPQQGSQHRRGSPALCAAGSKPQAAAPAPGAHVLGTSDPTQLAIQAAIMAQASAMLTVLTSDGTRVLYQNAASMAYYGDLSCTAAAGLAAEGSPEGSWHMRPYSATPLNGLDVHGMTLASAQEQPLARLFSLHSPGAIEVRQSCLQAVGGRPRLARREGL